MCSEWKRETWELENYPEGEKKEMIELYVEEGMTVEDATAIVNAFAKCECAPLCVARICTADRPRRSLRLHALLCADPDKFVNLMMVDELGLDKWDPQDLKGMWKQGAITMCSFWFFGGIPVITYAVASAAGVDSRNLIFLIDCIVTLLTMFLLGAAKAKVLSTWQVRYAQCTTKCGVPFATIPLLLFSPRVRLHPSAGHEH